MKNYIVEIASWNGYFYLTPELNFESSLGDNCIWEGELWDVKSIYKYVEQDCKMYNYKIKVKEI